VERPIARVDRRSRRTIARSIDSIRRDSTRFDAIESRFDPFANDFANDSTLDGSTTRTRALAIDSDRLERSSSKAKARRERGRGNDDGRARSRGDRDRESRQGRAGFGVDLT